MTDTVKCNSCNIVIDELLAFVQNKISIIDEVSLIQICTATFNSDQIKRSKSLLFDSVPTDKRNINRKNLGKESRDLEDLIALYKRSNSEELPIFVARDLEKLPPITFDHLDVTKLLKDLVLLRKEITDIKAQYATKEELEHVILQRVHTSNDSLQNRFRSINVNFNRGGGGFADSGPIGLSHLDMTVLDQTSDIINSSLIEENSEQSFQSNPQIPQQRIELVASEPPATMTSESAGTRGDSGTGPQPTERHLSNAHNTTSAVDDSSNIHDKDNVSKENSYAAVANTEGEWKVVTKRKNKIKYRLQGKKGSANECDGKFKAAVSKVPIFITNVHKDTMAQDIREYVQSKTNECITPKKISIKSERNYNAYTFLVSKEKLSMFLDNTLWPKGIIFRRFVHFRQRNEDIGLSMANYGNKGQLNG